MARGCGELEPERTGPTRLSAWEVGKSAKTLCRRPGLGALKLVPSGACASASASPGCPEQAFLGF